MRIDITTNIIKKSLIIFLILLTIITIVLVSNQNKIFKGNINSSTFNGERALSDVNYQVNLGARTPGSEAHTKTVDWIVDELKSNRWETEIVSSMVNGNKIQNIVGKKGKGRPWIILGVHYDSRIYASNDTNPANRVLPVPGANDGASGVAVLLELSRMFYSGVSERSWAEEIWLVFFDAEDNGDINGWSWIIGSRAFANNLQEYPDVVVILDMIGDEDLNIYRENNSDAEYTKEIWDVAASLGYENYFIPENKHTIIDDHIPFIEKGIPAVDIIDFNYPYWHTISDTADKVTAQSLSVVGATIYTWLTTEQQP